MSSIIQHLTTAPTLHLSTANKSAITLAKFYKDSGITNWSFLLHLYDAALINVDPFSPRLSAEMKLRISAECKRNPWYFFREISRIPVPGGHVQFEFNRGNVAQLFCCLNSINFLEMLPRQRGKTQGVIAGCLYLNNFIMKNTEMTFSNKGLGDSRLNVKRYKIQESFIPQWLVKRDSKNDIDNVDTYYMSIENNTIKALSTARSVEDAERLGRGLTTPIVWCDEFAFLKLNSVIYEAASPAQKRAAQEARKQGVPAFKAITTTPGDLDSEEAVYCKEMMNDAAPFNEKLFDMNDEQLAEYLETYSRNDFVYIEYSYRELGLDEKWFKDQCRSLNNKLLKIKREVLLQWTRTNDSSVYTEEVVESIAAHAKIAKVVPSGYKNYFFNTYSNVLDFNKFYMIGVDVAGGLTKDSSVITFVDPDTLKPVADISSNKIDTDDLTMMIYYLMDIFHNSLFAIERNNYGLPIIQRIVKQDKYRKRLFYRDGSLTDREKMQGDISKSQISFEGTDSRIYGIDTTGFSRDYMLKALENQINTAPETFISTKLVTEIQTLQYNKQGKIEHANGCHDDHIFSYMVACYAISLSSDFASNIKENVNRIGDFNNIIDAQLVQNNQVISNQYSDISVNNNLSAFSDDQVSLVNDLFFINSVGTGDDRDADMFNSINSLNEGW